ncbi:MAG TPA: RNA-binding cell elongation regulator Jag/EloR [Smithella sp.]|nr:Jag N-terminal domain-containing protein [Smithella sp.]MDM7986435.1 RNA-binding cell elongation regulator Jag/EloR [Smithella sp.]HNY50295.1 RNA-binding cell elongation regulator Jag/EloR [Smithella sp.]HOG89872.1 RNA-binding cell elongation regulator Jag/EloR [Smithella sp.]HOU49786.1 RNA-binding cell elongation regulator Jag/EloR [Smithella sp.]
MSSEIIEIEEKTIDEAIEKACLQFGVPREKLNIEIVSAESGGFLGLFSKKAKIRASLLALNIDFNFNEIKKENIPEIKEEEKEKKTTDDFKEKTEIKKEPAKRHKKEIIKEKPSVKMEKEVVYIDNSTMAVKAQELLEGILQRMSPEYHATVRETQEKIILGIEGDESGLLIGKRGQHLDALQYIMNKAINKIDAEHKMILIDSGEYRKRREEFLLGLAEKIREKVKKTRKPVSIANMNAHDRRIIHMFLQEDASLVTQSRGEGKYRKIVILPARTGNARRSREKKRD